MDLKLARLLAGVGGPRARSEVSALVSSMAEAGHGLPHPADRLAVVIEASQVTRMFYKRQWLLHIARCVGQSPDVPARVLMLREAALLWRQPYLAMTQKSEPHARRLQVVGAVGSARKRTLMLWQAVELSRAGDAPDTATLDIARRALEPPPDPRAPPPADTLGRKSGGPLASGVPRHWSLVRCGCIEGGTERSQLLHLTRKHVINQCIYDAVVAF